MIIHVKTDFILSQAVMIRPARASRLISPASYDIEDLEPILSRELPQGRLAL